MTELKTQSIRNLEEKLEGVLDDESRRLVLQCAKDFKTSWIALGQALCMVKKDRLFREWGYETFEGYAAKEIGIQKPTALKLIRSYYFLEKDEPWYLSNEHKSQEPVASVPHYEAVDVLRRAKNNEAVDKESYGQLKKAVFEEGKDVREVKKDLTALIKQREEVDPEEARQSARTKTVKRFIANLKSVHKEMESGNMVPVALLAKAQELIEQFETCVQ